LAAAVSTANAAAAEEDAHQRDEGDRNGRHNTLFGAEMTNHRSSLTGGTAAAAAAATVLRPTTSQLALAQQLRRSSSGCSTPALAERRSLLAIDDDGRRAPLPPQNLGQVLSTSASFACHHTSPAVGFAGVADASMEAYELSNLRRRGGQPPPPPPLTSPPSSSAAAVNPFQISDDEVYLNSWESKRSSRSRGGGGGNGHGNGGGGSSFQRRPSSSPKRLPRHPAPMGSSANQMAMGRHFNSEKYERIDRIAMWLFPIIFFLFNICYWSYYLLLNRLLPELW
jgi:uncharacterized membrane protein YgcG